MLGHTYTPPHPTPLHVSCIPPYKQHIHPITYMPKPCRAVKPPPLRHLLSPSTHHLLNPRHPPLNPRRHHPLNPVPSPYAQPLLPGLLQLLPHMAHI
jgi:hypothetical protein